MADQQKANQKKSIAVSGDVCLDVAGISVTRPSSSSSKDKSPDNWRLTGETRTHYIPGGAFLLTEFIRAALPDDNIHGPHPKLPSALKCGQPSDEPMSPEEFSKNLERLTRDEIVHSLIELDQFRSNRNEKKSETIRVLQTHGFSGPPKEDPSLELVPPDDTDGSPGIVVIDDTGNRFRRSPQQWPSVLTKKDLSVHPLIVYKLHRPLPGTDNEVSNPLWEVVKENHLENSVVIISVDDLRECGYRISFGLSWERTALDLVWHLLNVAKFSTLRNCPHLVVRLGLDGAVYWHCENEGKYHAWLIYDPEGIEGAWELKRDGKMIGYASAFVAAMVKELAKASSSETLAPEKDKNGNLKSPSKDIERSIKLGIATSRRLLSLGFGKNKDTPSYPLSDLFDSENDEVKKMTFACQKIPVIRAAANPDRGYWRLLDSIYYNRDEQLLRAVTLLAKTGCKDNGKEDEAAELRQAPVAIFGGGLRTYDRREMENYRALYSLMLDYVKQNSPPRPLSVAVFGPPGAGKSFGVKMVAKELSQLGGLRGIETLTFNLSQYRTADELAAAFHLVRDLVLRGKIPLVFFDEFDTAVDGKPLGWLRYFLSPMQDGEFLDRGSPHPIGQAIFVFAGGTFNSYAEFAAPFTMKCDDTKGGEANDLNKKIREEFKAAKGPDFLSRLRASLDIPGLDLNTPFDPYGDVADFPCEAAILLRRAWILHSQLCKKAPHLTDSGNNLCVNSTVLRALLFLPQLMHGNRSFEALLDMSHITEANSFTPSLLPADSLTNLHANATFFTQLLHTDYPFPPEDRVRIAKAIHKNYLEHQKNSKDYDPDKPAMKDWDELPVDYKESNLEQADHIVVQLRAAGLWIRKIIPGVNSNIKDEELNKMLEILSISEHDRWVAEKRRLGWIAGPDTSSSSRKNDLLIHNCLFRWDELDDETKELDRDPIRKIPEFLKDANYEIIKA